MRVEHDFLQRAYIANLLRIRAARQRGIAADRSASATRQELETEADWCEAQARRMDDGEEPAAVSDKTPIRLPDDTKRDINYIDEPKGGHPV